MGLEEKIVNRIIKFNIIIISFLILDNILPGKESEIVEISSFYTFTQNTGNTNKPTLDTKSILELKNGERYRIGKFPKKKYNDEQKIIIVKSIISENINKIKILDKKWETIYVGLFSNFILLLIFIIASLVTVLNIKISNKLTNALLIFSMMFLLILFFVYNFYF